MKKELKSILTLLILVMSIATLTACSDTSETASPDAGNQSQTVESQEPAENTVARADYAIPEEYTKVKIFFGSYGFGDAEIVSAMNDDESAFYMQFVCFDEDQILEGTVSDGVVTVTYDKTGFLTSDAQILYDDTIANEEPWQTLS